MATRELVDPRGHPWTVRRKWVHRRLRWPRRGRPSLDLLEGADVGALADDLPAVGVILAALGLVVAAVLAVMFVIPALVFLLDLVLIAVVVAVGLAGRMLLGRPWTVEARDLLAEQSYEWKVRGWRASGEKVAAVAEQLEATGEPTGGTQP